MPMVTAEKTNAVAATAIATHPPVAPPWRRLGRAGLRAAKFSAWCVNRLLYYCLPPAVHTALKYLAPRVCQREEQRRLLTGLRNRLQRSSASSPVAAPAAAPVASSAESTSGDNGAAPAFNLATAITLPPIDHSYLRQGEEVLQRYREAHGKPENSSGDLERKIAAYLEIAAGARVDRVRLLRELARLEQMRGKDLLACTYRLRAMRLLGADRHRDLAWVTQALVANGFPVEAATAEAMYGFAALRFPRCRQILQNALEYNRRPPAPIDFEILDDRREARPYKVSIIVSLYNAAPKLRCFLHALRNQTLLRKNEVEFVFLDSRSPADEHAALRAVAQECAIPYVFARTPARETIQTAWNRGIALSRSPYLTFLGVDETIVPEALEILSSELDANSTLDWVQGNSLVTEVDANGVFAKDVMLYDRRGYTQDHVYLETCYLSWVGALYRRSIHDRFGYYDGTFGAAGDTEIKGRLLPFLKTKNVPQTLGVFLNYPEARTTASPRAEIEDLRAWYLHRTLAGVDYALQRRDPADAEKLLLLALQYRKSYVKHLSTDVEYAQAVADYLADHTPASPTLALAGGVADLLAAYRALDYIQPLTVQRFGETLQQTRRTAERVQRDHRGMPWLQHITYGIHNDNRHEQHSFHY
jgi:glycosyltransferase involved in cell wall biosynthesis